MDNDFECEGCLPKTPYGTWGDPRLKSQSGGWAIQEEVKIKMEINVSVGWGILGVFGRISPDLSVVNLLAYDARKTFNTLWI